MFDLFSDLEYLWVVLRSKSCTLYRLACENPKFQQWNEGFGVLRQGGCLGGEGVDKSPNQDGSCLASQEDSSC